MAIDILLSTETNDIVVGTDLVLTQDIDQSVTQRLKIKLQFFLGEWVFNTSFGVPYYQTIFVKGVTQGQTDTIFRQQIEDTPQVTSITGFESVFNNATRDYTLRFSVLSESGTEIVVEL